MTNITLSKEELQVLKAAQCNFHGENPTARQTTILQYLEDQRLVEHDTQNHRTNWKLTPDGIKALHCAAAEEEVEEKKRKHNWAIAIFSVIGAGLFVLAAAIFC